MDLVDVEREMARLDAAYRPVAIRPVDVADLDRFKNLGDAVQADLAALAVDDQAETVLRAAIDLYAAGDETARAATRHLFDRYPSFRWAAHLPPDWDTAEEFRARLIHLSACDQGADPRDEILALRDLCDRARRAGVDVEAVLREVAAMSSDADRHGTGSMRGILLGCR
ncbi:hypothetical protein [Micromonospora narathiwatensis]|uniref:Uncharacterized protein n=1 Tax=Micromonospora narathiwatensis TaxID=299146 RepID=A0A1A8ZRG0_9ACTN|nr:hypothetical protein [Micromonospora narathiwatensis]SBT46413.1 hypothetical protein GA0070621_2603 [Micromonospora narathiwatensis]